LVSNGHNRILPTGALRIIRENGASHWRIVTRHRYRP